MSSHEIFEGPPVFSAFPLLFHYLFFFPKQLFFPHWNISLQPARRRATPLACPWERQRAGGWVQLPRVCCSPPCPSVPLTSAPGCSRTDVKQKGEAHAMLPVPAAAPAFLPKRRCPQALLSFWEWVGWTGDSLNFPYSEHNENNVVTVVFQWSVKSLRSKRFLHLNVKSNGSIHWVVAIFQSAEFLWKKCS